jgi:hypothetical protein
MVHNAKTGSEETYMKKQPKKRENKKICKDISKDEKEAVKLYHSLGYHKQARQEKKHGQFFRKECEKLNKKVTK